MNSIWTESAAPASFGALEKKAKTDVLIIGGGITGILCAFYLNKAGIDCMLVEAGRICGGITRNTTAKITWQHGLIYEQLIRRFGHDKARLYLDAHRWAAEEYSRLCQTVPCDYEKKDSAVYSISSREKIENEITALQSLGVPASFSEALDIPIRIAGAVCVQNQAQCHPLKFAYGISENLPIYENTKVMELQPHKAVTNRGEITCKNIIVATHFPILNKHGGYFLKLYQHRSYVLALENAKIPGGMYVDEDDHGLSFRNYQNLLLLGGGSHRTGKKGGNWHELEMFAKKHYPEAKIVGKWATQDCMSLDGMPYIGQYSKRTHNIYTATGFNKWGMTSSMLSARILTDLVQGKNNPYAELFSPSRSMMYPQLAVNAFESLIGILTPTVPRCPHLGCALKYNPQEHSWDCPCHGSRFTKSGELIDNPATDDKKTLKKR